MTLEKESLINFLPDGFETLNQEGYKENFSADKIATGYEKDVKDRVTGPNLNNLIDVIGKNTNTLNNYVEYLNNMPIGSVPIVNDNNNLDYASGFVQKSGDTMTGYLLGVTPPLSDKSTKFATTDFVRSGGWDMPSSKFTNLTLGASGTTYTAPANGWFYLQKMASGSQYVLMSNISKQPFSTGLNMSNGNTCYLYIPCQKGDVIRVDYNATGTTNHFLFKYAEGEI